MRRSLASLLVVPLLAAAALAQDSPPLLCTLVGGQYGFCDTNGVEVVAPRFDQIGFVFQDGRMPVARLTGRPAADAQGT